jgi:hypothetical protein
MEYRGSKPTTKGARIARRKHQQAIEPIREERNRQKARTGQVNEQGVTQGQNGEQGNTVRGENRKALGKLEH